MARLPDEPRPPRSIGMTLHMFPPDTPPRRRRVFLLTVTLLAVSAWGVLSVRTTRMGLAEYRTATAELVAELPYLIAAGRAVFAGKLKAVMPRRRPTR